MFLLHCVSPEDVDARAHRLWWEAIFGFDSLCLRGLSTEFSWAGLRAAERYLRSYGSIESVALADQIASLLRDPGAWLSCLGLASGSHADRGALCAADDFRRH